MCNPNFVERAIRVTACLGFGLLLTGCGGEAPVPVTGKVTLDGKPVAGASITFTPVDRKEGEVAVGGTDESGMYSLNLLKGEVKDGAWPGAYKVSISKEELVGGKTGDSNLEESFSSLGMPSGRPARAKSLIPAKYGRAMTSGLSFEVKRGEENTANFELSK